MNNGEERCFRPCFGKELRRFTVLIRTKIFMIKFDSGYVLQMAIDGFEISGVLRASMKDKSYKVDLNVDGKGGIKSAGCECPRGKWLYIAIWLYCNTCSQKGMSKTYLPNSWLARPKTATRKSSTKRLPDLFPESKPDFQASSRNFTEGDKVAFSQMLTEANVDCRFQWLASKEVEPVKDAIAPPLVEDLLPLFASDKQEFIKVARSPKNNSCGLLIIERVNANSLWGLYRRL
eukprot:gene5621-10832_t